jgi:hypothetical protein
MNADRARQIELHPTSFSRAHVDPEGWSLIGCALLMTAITIGTRFLLSQWTEMVGVKDFVSADEELLPLVEFPLQVFRILFQLSCHVFSAKPK